MLLADVKILPCDLERRADFRGLRFQHRERFGLLKAKDGRHAALQDSGLLASDLGDTIAEKFGVIHRHRRDERGSWMRNHIRRVDTASETDFEQQIIRRMTIEEHESGGGCHFEKGDRRAIIHLFARSVMIVGIFSWA